MMQKRLQDGRGFERFGELKKAALYPAGNANTIWTLKTHRVKFKPLKRLHSSVLLYPRLKPWAMVQFRCLNGITLLPNNKELRNCYLQFLLEIIVGVGETGIIY